MKISSSKIRRFQQKILGYYAQNRRDLPWRQTTDPYPIWISEVMLQQTQVSRVIDYHARWMTKWPTIQDLARASRTDVLKQWIGLGYNNRAINLHEAAKLIVKQHTGDVISAMKDFKNIKGIGPYTSCAVQIFSCNSDIATVDTNIRRILIHEFDLDESIKDKELWEIASRCVPAGNSRDWHNALMDYGATHLTSQKTGIKPKTRQSRFEGSDRQIRAMVLRHLLNTEKASFETLRELKDTEEGRMIHIIDKMISEGLISYKNQQYRLRS